MSSTITSNTTPLAIGTAPFLIKTYDMVDDMSTDWIVSWGKTGNTFVVWSVPEFARDLLPKYFKHNNFSSFVRQLNTYGFRKVDPDRWEFANEGFLRGQKHLLKIISRKKPSQVHNTTTHQQPQMQDKSVKSCVEVGNFGMEEEIERLKRDKNVLMQELVRLRQLQQTTDQHLQTVGQRVQVMEQKQQYLMSFLAKAMQSPGFLTQLVEQQDESNNSRRIDGVNKKRRLPNQDVEGTNSIPNQGIISPNGQIIKYQPLMNEAAKTMLGHIMKINGSPRLESTMSGGFLFNNMQSFADSSTSRVSGTSLSKTLSISSHPYLSTEVEVPTTCSSATSCESAAIPTQYPVITTAAIPTQYPVMTSAAIPTQYPVMTSAAIPTQYPVMTSAAIPTQYPVMTSAAIPTQYPVMSVPIQQDAFPSDLAPVQGLLSASSLPLPTFDVLASESGNMGFPIPTPGLVNELNPAVPDVFPCDPHVDNVVDEMPKLPGINDIFWEQFLSVSPVVGGSDKINAEPLDGCISTELDWLNGHENGWGKIQHMTHLTEQMGLLASEARKV